MKKRIALTAALLLLLSATGCTAPGNEPASTSEPTTQVSATQAQTASLGNPMTEYSSLEELNAICNGKLAKPPVMGVTDESFFTIRSADQLIAEYDFSVNGKACSMRFSSDLTNDISGVYIDGKTAFDGVTGESTAKGENCTLARWFTVDGQYVLNVTGEADDEWFNGIADEMKDLTLGSMSRSALSGFYASLEGDWQDTVSQRASATVKAVENGVEITVNWADSASLNNEWKMKACRTEDGLLNYTDCVYTKVDYSDSEDGKRTVVYENGIGFFSYSENGQLIWNGAEDENCKSCIFEKAE